MLEKIQSVANPGNSASAEFCRKRHLRPEFLQSLGVSDNRQGAILIPYRDFAGKERYVKKRNPAGASRRFDNPKGVEQIPYGEWRLDIARKAGELHLVEGESDCWTLWQAGFPALGIPGSGAFGKLRSQHLEGINRILIHEESKGGEEFVKGICNRLLQLGFQGETRKIVWPGDGVKDVSDFYCLAPPLFHEKFGRCIESTDKLDLHEIVDGKPKPSKNGKPIGNEWPEHMRGDAWEPPEPEKEFEESTASFLDLQADAQKIEWLWNGWIQKKAVNVLAADAGIGKTRLGVDLTKRIVMNLPWPDGSHNQNAGATVLWLPADNNHPEIAECLASFGVDLSKVILNASKEEPYGGTNLDEGAARVGLSVRIAEYRPALVIIDTALNATGCNLTKPEESKEFFGPLQALALRYNTAFLVHCHLNKEGTPLGRRIEAQARVVMKLDKPDEDQDKLRLRVVKSNSVKPSPLGVTMTSTGNEYDLNPPKEGEGKPGPLPTKIKEAMDWWLEFLASGPKRTMQAVNEGENACFSKTTIFRARDQLEREKKIERFEAEGKKFMQLTSNDT